LASGNPIHVPRATWGGSDAGVQQLYMKKHLAMAALLGATVGVGWLMVLGAVGNLGSSLALPWNAIMWVSCPPAGVLRTAWWLVPILNGVLYAGIAVLIQFFRKFIRPFAK
jgi:hypothetical protein